MEFTNRWKNNVFHYQKPTREFIKAVMDQVEEVVKCFCDIYEIDFARIKMNTLAMEDVITRIDMRLLYFSVFHEGMEPNEYKTINGLLIFWLLKRHPFWIDILPEDEEDIVRLASRINEKISLHIVIMLLEEYNSDFFQYGEDLVESYTRELEYSFMYRDLSKEALFLMFDPLYYEHIFSNSYKENSLIF